MAAENTTNGNIAITSGKDITASGSIKAGKNVAMTADGAINSSNTASAGNIDLTAGDKITASGNMTASGAVSLSAAENGISSAGAISAGNNITIYATAGEVAVTGNLISSNGNIRLDSQDGSDISAAGDVKSVNGTITLGHAPSTGVTGTGNVVIGEAAAPTKVVQAKGLNVNAADSIVTKNANITVTDSDVTLESQTVNLDGTALTVNGNASLLAGNFNGADWTAADGNTIVMNNTGISATGDVSLKAGKITVTTDGEAPAKEISGKNLLLAAANSYDDTTKKYTMGIGQTVNVTNTNLTGSESTTLIGYNVDVKGDVNTERLLGAVGKEIITTDDGSDVEDFVSPELSEVSSKLSIKGRVESPAQDELIYIGLYGDAEFINESPGGTQTMSFSANSPYSLDISGDMNVTDPGGIRLSSKSIHIADNLTASHAEASIVLGTKGGELSIAGNLVAGKDVIVRSTDNIIVGKDDGNVAITAVNGNVEMLAGTFSNGGINGAWAGGTGATDTAENNNIAIKNAIISAKENVDIKGGSISVDGTTNTVESTDGLITMVAANRYANGVYTTGANNDIKVSESLVKGESVIEGAVVYLKNANLIDGNMEIKGGVVVISDTLDKAAGAPTATLEIAADKVLLGDDSDNVNINLDTLTTKSGDVSVKNATINTDETFLGGKSVTVENSQMTSDAVTVAAFKGFAPETGNYTTENGNHVSINNGSNITGDKVDILGYSAEIDGNINADLLRGAVGTRVKEVDNSLASIASAGNNTMNFTAALHDKAGTLGKTEAELDGDVLSVDSNKFKTLTLTGKESISLGGSGTDAISVDGNLIMKTKNLTIDKNLESTKSIRLQGETVTVKSEVTAAEDLTVAANTESGGKATIDGAKLSSGTAGEDYKTVISGNTVEFKGDNTLSGTVEVNAGNQANITGTLTAADAASASLTLSSRDGGINIGGSAEDSADIKVDSLAIKDTNKARLQNVNLQNDITIEANEAVLAGNIKADGKMLDIASDNAIVGDGVAATSVLADKLITSNATTKNLTIDKADVTTVNEIVLKSSDQITLKGEITANELNLDTKNVYLGDGTKNTVINADSVATGANTKNITLAQVDLTGIGDSNEFTAKATEQIVLRGKVDSGERELVVDAPNVSLGDGTMETSIIASSLKAVAREGNKPEKLTVSKAGITADNVEFDVSGSINIDSSRMQGTDVAINGKEILIENGTNITVDNEVGQIALVAADTDTGRNSNYTAGKARSLTLNPSNTVVIDNSRLEGANMTFAGYSVTARNGSKIYAAKTLNALAGSIIATDSSGKLEVVTQGPGNKLIQLDSEVVVAGDPWYDFQPFSDWQSYLQEKSYNMGMDNALLDGSQLGMYYLWPRDIFGFGAREYSITGGQFITFGGSIAALIKEMEQNKKEEEGQNDEQESGEF